MTKPSKRREKGSGECNRNSEVETGKRSLQIAQTQTSDFMSQAGASCSFMKLFECSVALQPHDAGEEEEVVGMVIRKREA